MPDRSPLRRTIAPLLAALVVLILLFAAVTWLPLRTARDQWRHGRVANAIATADGWSRAHMWPRQYDQILAAAFLTGGHPDAAKPHLDALRGHELWFSVIAKPEVANRLFTRGDYAGFLAYDGAVHSRNEPAESALYRAAALTATDRVAEANAALRGVDRRAVDARKLGALQAALAQRASGQAPYVLDRDGRVTAMRSLRQGEGLSVVNTDYSGFLTGAGNLTIAAQAPRLGNTLIETTLDSTVQRAAKEALKGYRGALVAIDPRTNEILAIASNDPGGHETNLAIEAQYEPGSIIKVLTGLNALSSGIDTQSMFPYHCSGDLLIDGRHFGDWLPYGHGDLPDLDEALAESCNVFFADVGLKIGADRLRRFMIAAGFDGQTDLGLFKVPLGRLKGEALNHFETASLAIGLEHESVNAIHVAMLASMMANRGVLTTPRLLRDRRSVLGEIVAGPAPQAQARIATREAADRMVQAMVAVVQRPKGTGRRVDLDDVPLALKTGTAGERANGYQAVIMAFAPVDSPRIAFGMIAENAGPAEYAGAKIAHDFLSAIRERIIK
jgi:penicillin-binding protein A